MLKHLALFVAVLFSAAVYSSAEDKLRRAFANYDKTQPPSTTGETTTVKVGVYIKSLELDVTREMKICMYFRQSWTDARLSGLGNRTVRLLDFDKIWLPDTFIRNDKQDELAPGEVSNKFRLLKVSHGNSVWYVVKLRATVTCMMGKRRYPKDAPVCEMLVESFGYTADVMNLDFLPSPIDFDPNALMSGGIYLVNTEISDCSVNYTAGTYPCLNFKLFFRRAVSHQFFTVVYLPSAVVVLVSTSSFWIQADKPTPRLLVGLLTTLTVTLHAAAVRLYYVSTETYMTLLDLWLNGCALVVFVAFVLQLAGVVIAQLKAKKHSEATKVEAAAAESSGSKPMTFVTDLVGKIAIPVLFLLLIIIYATV